MKLSPNRGAAGRRLQRRTILFVCAWFMSMKPVFEPPLCAELQILATSQVQRSVLWWSDHPQVKTQTVWPVLHSHRLLEVRHHARTVIDHRAECCPSTMRRPCLLHHVQHQFGSDHLRGAIRAICLCQTSFALNGQMQYLCLSYRRTLPSKLCPVNSV